MARNNPKPTENVDWEATGEKVTPSAGRKLAGWLFNIKPPAQNFNWFWNLMGLQQVYSNAQVEDWIVIDSDGDEGDYATLAAYLADAPAAGNRILVKEDQTVTVQTVIPDNVTLKFLDGARLLCATNIATSVLKIGNSSIIEGVLPVRLSHTGTTAKAVEFDGNNVVGKIDVNNASTGILTTAYHINANKTGNRIRGFAQNTGGGTLSNIIIDNSTEDSNLLEMVDNANNEIVRSSGAKAFRDGLEYDLGSDADGDIYYRDAGILKRLAKGYDADNLKLDNGIPSWTRPVWSFPLQIGNDLNIAGIGDMALATLDSTDVAFVDDTNKDLRTYRFDGTTWAQVGNDLNIATMIAPALAALNSTDVAFIDRLDGDLRTYRFDGTDWAQVGNDLNITGTGELALAALNGTDVAFIDETNEDLRVYRFDGTDWAQVGNDLNIAGITTPALAALNGTDVAFIDETNEDLRVYRFDGTDWAQVGNDLNIAGITTPALATLNGTDVTFSDTTNDDLRMYRFGGTDWAQVGNNLSIATLGVMALTAFTDTDIAFIDIGNDDFRTYRWL